MKQELKIFAWLAAIFGGVYFPPVGTARFEKAVFEALGLTKWYAREHLVLCLLPAFWIAGAIVAFFYSGPAVNALVVVLTVKIPGWKIGLAYRGGGRANCFSGKRLFLLSQQPEAIL